MLTLGSGTNILGLMAAQIGARRVTCIEQGPMLYRMAKQTLLSNTHMPGAKCIVLVDKPLQACGIVGMMLTRHSPAPSVFCLLVVVSSVHMPLKRRATEACL